MEIQYMSDLHLEYEDSEELMPEIPVKSDILVLAGDICMVFNRVRMEQVLLREAKKFKKVLYVPGNHEYYYSVYPEANKIMEEICAKHENLEFMDKKSMKINGIRFLGCCLWSQIVKEAEIQVSHSLQDFQAIRVIDKKTEKPRYITVEEYNMFHETDRKWLESELEKAKENEEKVVVISHHTPLFEKVCPPQYEGSITTYGFANKMRGFVEEWSEVIKIWICGHTHYCFSQDVKGVKVVSNQCGYLVKGNEKKRCSDFDVGKTISV